MTATCSPTRWRKGFGSLGLMTSVLMTPDGKTVLGRGRARHRDPPLSPASAGTRHLDQCHGLDLRLDAVRSSIAPSSTTMPSSRRFADTLERVVVDTIEAGFMTKDLALLVGAEQSWLSTTGFLDKIDDNLRKEMADRAAA